MIKTFTVIATTAVLLAACGQASNDHAASTDGPVVAASTDGNHAVDTVPTKVEPTVSAGASSFTEDQARGALENAGYVLMGPLNQNANGIWQGKATKDGNEVAVAIDYKGAITQPK